MCSSDLVPAGGTNTEVTGRALWADPNSDLGPEDLEKAFYVCMAQVDVCTEAINAKVSVEQLVATKEAEAKAEAAASKAAKAKVGDAVAPTAPPQPVDDPVVSAKDMEASAGGVKRPSGSASAPLAKRARRRKPESLGTRDG